LKISFLKLKNCLGVKELEFKPGEITLIEGEEGQGKTSILESIQRFFYNKSERQVFVNSDAEKAETYLDLDDGTTMKKYVNKDGKTTTTTIDKGGMSPNKPEDFLKGLVSERQLNPISLIQMEDKDLTALILSLMPIKVTKEDLQAWLQEIPLGVDCGKHGLQVCKEVEKYYFDARTDLNRKIKDLSGEIKTAITKLPENYNADEWRNVSLQEKYEAISNANKDNAARINNQTIVDRANDKVEAFRSSCKIDIAEAKRLNEEGKLSTNASITNLEVQIALLKLNLEQADSKCVESVADITESYKKLANNVTDESKLAETYLAENTVIDIAPLEAAHKEAETMKSYVRTADDLKVKETDFAAKEIKAKDYKNKIEYMRTKPQMLLAKAEMPIEGLAVDSQGFITINERPIISLSGGERIKFVMNIVRATAGELKIILIDGFEKLSPKGQMEFINECSGDGFQYIITKVTDGEMRITSIQDGKKIDALTGEQL